MSQSAVLRDASEDDIPNLAGILRDASRKAYTFMVWDHTDKDFLCFFGGTYRFTPFFLLICQVIFCACHLTSERLHTLFGFFGFFVFT